MRFIKNFFHFIEAILANVYYGFPSRKLKVIGITGTDGKTTTAHLIYHILKKAAKRVSMISSVYADIGGITYDTGLHTTTPSAFAVQKYLSQSAGHNDEFFVLETTSHALDQYRVWGVGYAISVLTNVTREHLDYHKNYNEYLKTKIKLLQQSQIACVNVDDQSYKEVKRLKLIKFIKVKIFTYSLRSEANIVWDNQIKTSLLGDFNKQNILAAYAVGKSLGIDKNIILAGIETFKLPQGRLDVVYNKDFKVIIDFAHTPNALKEVLSTIRRDLISKKGRLIHIFGSAGLRDHTKRPFMGEASGQYADIVILTEEDYRVESLQLICEQIAQGLKKEGFIEVLPDQVQSSHHFTIVLKRLDGIKLAIALAQKGDVVVLTGKGHEKSLCRGKTEYPWDEYEAVKQALELKSNKI